MKQTNNAIKFLMAQYRAIFRNANLKMFLAAATAAAALSAGQAQAAKADAFTNEDLKTATGTIEVVGDTASGDKYKKITLSGGAVVPETAENLKFLVTSGSDSVLKGIDGKAKIDLSTAEMVLKSAQNAIDVTVTVGADKATEVSLSKLDVVKGKLVIKTAAKKDVAATLSATTISVGSSEAGGEGTIEIGDYGTLGVSGNQINVLSGGKIEAKGADTKASKIAGTLTVKSGGSVEVGAAGFLDIDDSVTVDADGALKTAATGKITLKNGGTFAAESIVHSGTLVLQGGSTVALAGAVSGDAGAQSVLQLEGDTTVTMKYEDLKKFLKGTVQSSSNNAGTISLTDDTEIDLSGEPATGALVSGDGTVLNKAKGNSGKLTIHAATAKFAGADALTGSDANAGLTLSFDTLSLGKGDAKVAVTKTALEIGNALNIAKKQDLELGDGASLTLNAKDAEKHTVDAKSVIVGTSAKAGALNVNNGTWTLPALDVKSGTAVVSGSTSVLNVTGALSTAGAKGKLEVKDGATVDVTSKDATVSFKGQGVALSNAAVLKLDGADIFKKDTKELDDTKYAAGAVAGSANSIVHIMNGNDEVEMTEAEYKKFREASGFKGLFNVKLTGDVTAEDEMKLTDTVAGVSTEKYSKITVNHDGAEITDNYSVGNVNITTDKDLVLGANGGITLQDAKGGNFVSKKSGASSVEAGVQFNDADNSLTLVGSGKIGAILTDGQTSNKGTVTLQAKENTQASIKVIGGIGKKEANNGIKDVSVLDNVNLEVASGGVFADNLAVAGSSSLVVDGDVLSTDANVDGKLQAKTLTLSGTVSQGQTVVEHNFASANVDVEKLVLADKNVLNIGRYDPANKENNATGSVYASSLELNGGSVFIDPNYDQTKSSAVVMNLSGAATNTNAGTLDGKVAIGTNAAFGVGFNSIKEMDEVIAGYLTDGHFTQDTTNGGVHNALVLNKGITLDQSKGGIMVGENASISGTTVKTVDFGANSALVITDNVFDNNGGVKTGTAISGADTVKVGAGVELVLVGDFNAKDDALDIFGSANPSGTMKVMSLNGLLVGEWKGGKLDLNLTDDEKILSKAFIDSAAPIRELLLDSKKGELGSGDGLGRDLINKISSVSLSGAVVDAAAHAATYAGAQQAAVAAVGTMAEAVGGRVGSMGVEAATISATGSQANGGVWLSPMYKSVDADGFDAQGASYGADVDLAGVAFGADTVNGNMRFGAVFNIGSGDADGKGNGNGLKDEFDYYGFGMYSVMGFGNFALVGDASLNVISHDVEGLGFKGEADTTAVTMGVTGQYTISNPAVDVTPHIGARFIRLDTDSYDLVADGETSATATTDFDVQNVFSVPLGVTLSKAFEMGGWSLAPSADLSITFNTGDTEVESTTRFSGVNRNIGLTTEVLDEVTYGVAVGLGAQYGAFGTNIGINYTGSSNTDAFGVNANARYMF